MTSIKCSICDDTEGKAFRAPYDWVGIALMEGHLQEAHGIRTVISDDKEEIEA